MEAQFSQLTLDVIGLSVFNYDYDSLSTDRRALCRRAAATAAERTVLGPDRFRMTFISRFPQPRDSGCVHCAERDGDARDGPSSRLEGATSISLGAVYTHAI